MNILITGASRGIGAAAYALLKARDHRVVGHSTMGSDELVAGDLTDPTAPRDIWDTALAELDGQIDVLVNNAGIYEAVPDNATDEEWHLAWARTMSINLQAAADLSKLAVSHFLDLGIPGRIINIASRAAFRGDSPQHWHYAASKAGLVGMTRTIRPRESLTPAAIPRKHARSWRGRRARYPTSGRPCGSRPRC